MLISSHIVVKSIHTSSVNPVAGYVYIRLSGTTSSQISGLDTIVPKYVVIKLNRLW